MTRFTSVSYTHLEEFVSVLELNMASDRRQLQLIATLASGYMTRGSGELLDFLAQYPGGGDFFSRLEFLLPGDRVLTAEGKVVPAAGQLSFEQEAALGAHISDREQDLNGGGYVVRHFVPVTRDGETIAMLYGVIDIDTLGEALPYSPYGGSAAVYLIDGATGDFLIDTWHEELGNIWETGSRPIDVYKRQGRRIAPHSRYRRHSETGSLPKALRFMCRSSRNRSTVSRAVSYTHLDVYKRQV